MDSLSRTRPVPFFAEDEFGEAAVAPAIVVLARQGTGESGLSRAEADRRLREYGPNVPARERQHGVAAEIVGCIKSPLNALLSVLAATSWALGDSRAAVVIASMIVLSVLLAFVQQHRANRAAHALRALVRTHATVRRDGKAQDVPLEAVVPGDLVELCAGDLVPGDLRLLHAKDLHVNQASLTGEAMPAEKSELPDGARVTPLESNTLCFMGSNVLSGTGVGLVLRTGPDTLFGRTASATIRRRPPTAFDRGIAGFTYLMLSLIGVMVPAVLLINGLTKGDWSEATLFALAVGVGLTPEMLPAIVTVNLAKGAVALSHQRVIVKRLNAIQDFGAMDVLCTDKTGTLTQDRVVLQSHLDLAGGDSPLVLRYAYLNSRHQSGLRNLLDEAVIRHSERPEHAGLRQENWTKRDEIPFDFERRRLSVVLEGADGSRVMVTKGAVEEVFGCCTQWMLGGETGPLDPSHLEDAKRRMAALNRDGFRVVAVAFKSVPEQPAYTAVDERDLTLLGFVAFLDPPKDGVPAALAELARLGVQVKVLTGDNELVAATVCRMVGLEPGQVLLGAAIGEMDDPGLEAAAESTTIFAKLSPDQKSRVVAALRRRGHVVGYLGDGINDGPALHGADVGISVNTAVDVAKEAADLILLEKSLAVLSEGVAEGRRVFGNVIKYIRMGASSNFGNMFSVLGASAFLPFVPMAPVQVLTNNLLYDFSQAAIPTDRVDPEYVARPRKWDIAGLLRFVLLLGPISSIFDYATFAALIWVFGAWTEPALFQTGWFLESLLTQTLIIHLLRTARLPLVQSRASLGLTLTTLAVCAVGMALPFTSIGAALGFVSPPAGFWPVLASIMLGYAALAQVVKSWFVRRWGF
jgi:Mg2+-importing ATPase